MGIILFRKNYIKAAPIFCTKAQRAEQLLLKVSQKGCPVHIFFTLLPNTPLSPRQLDQAVLARYPFDNIARADSFSNHLSQTNPGKLTQSPTARDQDVGRNQKTTTTTNVGTSDVFFEKISKKTTWKKLKMDNYHKKNKNKNKKRKKRN